MYQTNLTAEQKEAWLKQLRDPTSKQALNRMFEDATGAMCCLEHGCKVMMPNWRQVECGDSTDHYTFINELIGFDASRKLIDLNDREGFALHQIANWIEPNLKIKDSNEQTTNPS